MTCVITFLDSCDPGGKRSPTGPIGLGSSERIWLTSSNITCGERRGRRAEHLHAEGAMAAAQVHAHLWGEARGRRAEHPLASLLASELKSYLRISITISNLKPHLGISISISISNLKLHLGDARHKLLALLGVIELGLSVGSDVLR